MVFRAKHLLLLVALNLGLTSQSFAQPIDNFGFLSQLCDKLIHEAILDSLPENEFVRVVAIDEQDKNNWFFEERIVEQLKQGGYRIFVGQTSNTADGGYTRIDFRVLEIGITYEKQPDENSMKRSGHLQLFTRVVDEPTGEIIVSATPEVQQSDHIATARIDSVQRHDIPFVKGSFVSSASETKWLPPVAISVAAGVIVYLFYALRSR